MAKLRTSSYVGPILRNLYTPRAHFLAGLRNHRISFYYGGGTMKLDESYVNRLFADLYGDERDALRGLLRETLAAIAEEITPEYLDSLKQGFVLPGPLAKDAFPESTEISERCAQLELLLAGEPEILEYRLYFTGGDAAGEALSARHVLRVSCDREILIAVDCSRGELESLRPYEHRLFLGDNTHRDTGDARLFPELNGFLPEKFRVTG
jgi:hypothetical protein